MLDVSKILILAPHTDDGELGCGGTMAKMVDAGKEVHYAAFSLCKRSLPAGLAENTLEKECRAATKELGLAAEHLRFYDHEVREFALKRQEILEELVSLNKHIKPDLIFIPAALDIHQDHQVIHTEALRAFKESSMLGYELPWNHASFRSTYFIRLTEDEVEKKVRALQSYESQSHRNYMQEDFARSLARVRGVQCNARYAEAFEIYRMIS